MNLPPKSEPIAQKEPKSPKPLFRAPKPGETAYILVPSDENEYQKVLEEFAKLELVQDDLPKLRKEIPTEKLGKNHVIYVACVAPTKLDFQKQPIAFKLKVSPPIAVGGFIDSVDEDDENLNVGKLVDALNILEKGKKWNCQPFRVALSNDKSIKLMWM